MCIIIPHAISGVCTKYVTSMYFLLKIVVETTFFLSLMCRSSSAGSIRFHQAWAVLFWYVATEFSGLQFPKVLFMHTEEVTTQGNVFRNTGRLGVCVNGAIGSMCQWGCWEYVSLGRLIVHLYSAVEFGETYKTMRFILNEPYLRDFVRGEVLLWPSTEWSCRCTRRAYRALENIVSYWTFHNRS